MANSSVHFNKIVDPDSGREVLTDDIADSSSVITSTGDQTLVEALDSRATDSELAQLRADTLLEVSLTVNIPTDYATLQEAVDDLSTLSVKQGSLIDLVFESGHTPSAGLLVENGDYGMFRISSVDPVVTVSPSLTDTFLQAVNARAPVLNCLVDLAPCTAFGSYTLNETSLGVINPGCGLMNGTRGAHVHNGSKCYMDEAVFTGFQQAGIHASRNGTIQCSYANLSGNSQEPTNTFGAVYASRASQIHGADIDATNSGGDGVRAQRAAIVSVPGINVSGATKIALVAVSSAHIYSGSNPPTMTGLLGRAIVAQQCAVVAIDGTTITLNGSSTDSAIEASNNSQVSIGGSTISGHSGINIYASSSSVSAGQVNVSGGTHGIFAEKTSSVDASLSQISNASSTGVLAQRGANVCVISGSVSGSSMGDLSVIHGAWISANGCSTTNGSGSPSLGDTNLTGGFNFADNGGRGFIWV